MGSDFLVIMKAIVAMASNRVIGNGVKIPWHIPDDFKWFKSQTTGQSLLMGNTTFKAIGKPLPNRHTFVMTRDMEKLKLSSQPLYSYVTEEWLLHWLAFSPDAKDLWLCGGAKIYERFLPYCNEIVVSHVVGDFDGDVFMPPFEHFFFEQEILLEHKDFHVVRYSK